MDCFSQEKVCEEEFVRGIVQIVVSILKMKIQSQHSEEFITSVAVLKPYSAVFSSSLPVSPQNFS